MVIDGQWEVISKSTVTLDKTDYRGERIEGTLYTLRPSAGASRTSGSTATASSCNISVLLSNVYNYSSNQQAGDASVSVYGCGLGYNWSHQLLRGSTVKSGVYTFTGDNSQHTDTRVATCKPGFNGTWYNEVPAYDQTKVGYRECY